MAIKTFLMLLVTTVCVKLCTGMINDLYIPLGMQFGKIQDSQIEACCSLEPNFPPENARLQKTTTWTSCEDNCKNDTWIQVQFHDPVAVGGIQTQGRSDKDQWVTTFVMMLGMKASANSPLQWVKNDTFIGNQDRSTVVTNNLSVPVASTVVRIVPREYHGAVSLRFEILGNQNPCLVKLCQNESNYCIEKSNAVGGFPCSCSPGFNGILCKTTEFSETTDEPQLSFKTTTHLDPSSSETNLAINQTTTVETTIKRSTGRPKGVRYLYLIGVVIPIVILLGVCIFIGQKGYKTRQEKSISSQQQVAVPKNQRALHQTNSSQQPYAVTTQSFEYDERNAQETHKTEPRTTDQSLDDGRIYHTIQANQTDYSYAYVDLRANQNNCERPISASKACSLSKESSASVSQNCVQLGTECDTKDSFSEVDIEDNHSEGWADNTAYEGL